MQISDKIALMLPILPNVAALTDVYGKEKVSVIHFDSHYDAWWGGSQLISHGYPVYRLINEGHIRAADYIQVGLRSSGPDKAGFQWMREQGMRYHNMAEVEQRDWDAVLDRVVAEASEEGRKLHISFDIDVLDPAFAVATGTPVPGGLTMREAITIVRRCVPNQTWLASTWSNYIRHSIPLTKPRSTVPTSSRRA